VCPVPVDVLQLLFARDQIINGQQSLLGPLPPSIARAESLQYLQLSNIGLIGMIPELPPKLR